MKSRLFFLLALGVVTLVVFDTLTAQEKLAEDPCIEFTYVPPYGSTDNLEGRVTCVDPADYKVAVYIFVEGAAWWTKPTFAHPLTDIQPDSTWECDITTGGSDIYATQICAFLLPDGIDPPLADGDPVLPDTLYSISVAYVCTTRTPTVISFSGYKWWVKASVNRVGPGPNYFSDSTDNVWVDEWGQLHLRITKRSGKWYCGEVFLPYDISLGYGKYVFCVIGRIGQLDSNAVLGLFTWDKDSPEEFYREIDIEFSRFGAETDTNAQYVIQPWYHSGNRHRWIMPELVDTSKHSFVWEPDSICFLSVMGCQCVPPFDTLHSWCYTGPDVPNPGDENVRINLWLFNGNPPADTVEVIIAWFEYYPLLGAIDDLTISLAGNDIYLLWTEPHAEAGVDHYVVYRSTVPDSLGDSLSVTVDTTYLDIGAAGTVGTNYFYTVKAVDAADRKSDESNRVGEFDRSLTNLP